MPPSENAGRGFDQVLEMQFEPAPGLVNVDLLSENNWRYGSHDVALLAELYGASEFTGSHPNATANFLVRSGAVLMRPATWWSFSLAAPSSIPGMPPEDVWNASFDVATGGKLCSACPIFE
ncbi:hypothetical protein [Sorangium sp. So ce117]|uniref:hypothetical protein n=1 Tax=Sorangium sp. So ce117 TaxID=3133277 RepID=UPI003F5E7C75